MTREDTQKKAEELAQSNNVLLLFSVRLGKTLTALKISQNFGNKHLIVTSETLIVNTIKDEIQKWNFRQEDYTVICYDSVHKYVNQEFDCVILDESEHITVNNVRYFEKIKAKRWVALCAKMSRDKKNILKSLFNFKQLKVTYNEAVQAGILAQPKFYLVNIYLDNRDKNHVYLRTFKKYNQEITCDYRDRFKHFAKPYNLKVLCTAQEYYSILDEDIEYAKKRFFQNQTEFNKVSWLSKGSARKKWLGLYKTEYAKKIISWMQKRDKRFMVFCTDINQAETLGRGDGVTHSKNKNDDAIIKFNNGDVNELYVVDRGKEGITIYGIEEGLIIQASGSETANYQRAGRLTIADNPIVYVLVVKNTKDEDYVKKLKEDISEKFIEEIDYRDFEKNF